MSNFAKPFLAAMIATSLLTAAGAGAHAAEAGPQCLRGQDIRSTKATDDSTLLFYMKDHKIWRNALQSPCIGLTTDGFSYLSEPNDVICGNVETIRTVQMRTICKLGTFTPYAAPR